MRTSYVGITYPCFLGWGMCCWLWKRLMCPKHIHIFDEVWSDKHYLVCDACHLEIHIEKIV